jgi:hypothetical protein
MSEKGSISLGLCEEVETDEYFWNTPNEFGSVVIWLVAGSDHSSTDGSGSGSHWGRGVLETIENI